MPDKRKSTFRLYIAGIGRDNQKAILKFKRMIQDKAEGDVDFEVIDVLVDSERAMRDGVLATPTVIKEVQSPIVKVILDIMNEEKLEVGVDMLIQANEKHD